MSVEVATRMVENADVKTYSTKEKRMKALGSERDFPKDAMMIYMTRHAEEIFEPKRVLHPGDWLKKYRNPDQFFDAYKRGYAWNIQWVSPTKNMIYIFAAENDSFSDQ